MRYVDLSAFTPSAAWREKSRVATEELKRMVTMRERLDYIEDNAHVWRELRDELINKFGSRCWFTDAKETIARLDTEHFRPKAKALEEDGSEREGYWWLAFELSNLRLAGQVMNREYKKNYFPLLAKSFVANFVDPRWQDELPVFLDPTRVDDVLLVAYNETGAMCPSQNADSPEAVHRVTVTNNLLGLSSWQPLIEARQEIWSACRSCIEEIIKLKSEESKWGVTPRTKDLKSLYMKKLLDLSDPNAHLSSVARSCLEFSGHKWAVTLISHS